MCFGGGDPIALQECEPSQPVDGKGVNGLGNVAEPASDTVCPPFLHMNDDHRGVLSLVTATLAFTRRDKLLIVKDMSAYPMWGDRRG